MRGTLGLPVASDPEVLEGLDYRPWVRLTTRLQAHLAACAQPLAAEEISLATKIKEVDVDISQLYSIMVEKQRANARHAERLARVREVTHQLCRCSSLLDQVRRYSLFIIPLQRRAVRIIGDEEVTRKLESLQLRRDVASS
ncbi:hypothetical protein evm_013471 [Chilo suppressalis]|nr:hypothetical protein evm_013471 [Chilo suppressalis]